MTILGTRPEIIKMSPLLPLLDANCNHTLVHTGQHYDDNMDRIFFSELKLREPDKFLEVGSAGPAIQIGRMLERLEPIITARRVQWVVVQGDTNSTLAGALTAAKNGVQIAHVEAGCRSFDTSAPEEQNRIMVDHLSRLLFVPDKEARSNLRREGIFGPRVSLVGSSGLDATQRAIKMAGEERLSRFGVEADRYALVTVHRAENTNSVESLRQLIDGINRVSLRITVLFPIHPRTRSILTRRRINLAPGVQMLPPLGYLDFLALLKNCMFVMTDSGGIQEEAAVVNKPCLVLREHTEWTRLLNAGKNFLVGSDARDILKAANGLIQSPSERRRIACLAAPLEFGAAKKIVARLINEG